MCEYGVEWPLWTEEGPVTPSDLGLSDDLASDIRAWDEHFVLHFHWQSGWDRLDAEEWHRKRGRRLRRWLQAEVGRDVEVVFEDWP